MKEAIIIPCPELVKNTECAYETQKLLIKNKQIMTGKSSQFIVNENYFLMLNQSSIDRGFCSLSTRSDTGNLKVLDVAYHSDTSRI